MKKIIILLSLFILTISIKAQTISKQVISSLGNNLVNNSNKLSYNIGEVIVGPSYAEDGSILLASGYYPSLSLETLSIEIPNTAIKFNIYPNPVNELLYISHPTENNFYIYISDITGKKIFKGEVQKQNPVNISQYPKGIYLLTVITGEIKKTNTYKIIKL